MAESKTPFSSGDYSVLLGPKIFEIREGNQKMNALKKLLAKIKKLFLLNDVHYINGPETLPPPLSKRRRKSCCPIYASATETMSKRPGKPL